MREGLKQSPGDLRRAHVSEQLGRGTGGRPGVNSRPRERKQTHSRLCSLQAVPWLEWPWPRAHRSAVSVGDPDEAGNSNESEAKMGVARSSVPQGGISRREPARRASGTRRTAPRRPCGLKPLVLGLGLQVCQRTPGPCWRRISNRRVALHEPPEVPRWGVRIGLHVLQDLSRLWRCRRSSSASGKPFPRG